MTDRSVSLAVAIFCLIEATVAYAGDKPAVPPQRDPGGIAVAFVGGGIDYTQPVIAARLARDGEGEIVGFDLIDEDRRPFARGSATTQAAHELIAANSEARVVAFRVDAENIKTVGKAIAMVAASPAQIVVLEAAVVGKLSEADLAAVASRLSEKLVIVSGPHEKATANVVRVRGCDPRTKCGLDVATGVDPKFDVGVSTEMLSARDVEGATADASGAAVIAAVAIALGKRSSDYVGATLKGQIIWETRNLGVPGEPGWLAHGSQLTDTSK